MCAVKLKNYQGPSLRRMADKGKKVERETLKAKTADLANVPKVKKKN